MKPVSFIGNSLDALRSFPDCARREAGFQIDRLQRDLDPDDWKPMKTIGAGVREIRVRDASGAFRVIYIATLEDAVYILHAFQKKSKTGIATPKPEISLIERRLKQVLASYTSNRSKP